MVSMLRSFGNKVSSPNKVGVSDVSDRVRQSLPFGKRLRAAPAAPSRRDLSTDRCSPASGSPLRCSPLLAPACAFAEDIACEGPCLSFEGGTPKNGRIPRIGAFLPSAPVCATSAEDIADEGPRLLLGLPGGAFSPRVGNWSQLPLQLSPEKSNFESEVSTECGDSRPSTRSNSPAPSGDACSEGTVGRSRLSTPSRSPAPSVDRTSLPVVSDLDALEVMLCGHRQRNVAKSKPLAVERLQGVSLATVCGKLVAEDWAIHHLLRGNSRASGFAFSSPAPGRSGGELNGTQVRRSEFRMRLPQDVPKAISALVGVPESTRITQVYSLSITDAEVVLVQQTTSHDVMYGDNFRVQETFSWRTAADGSVEQYTWSEVAWTRSLPWTHGAIKTFIDKSTKKEAKELAASLAKIMAR